MDLLNLSSGPLRVSVSPAVGGAIYSMEWLHRGRWVHLMRPTEKEALEAGDAGAFASFHMLPYSNRIKGAVLRFDGQEYALAVNTPEGHAIHGEVRTRPWQVIAASGHLAELFFDSMAFPDISWPFPFEARLIYGLTDQALHLTMEMTNTGLAPCPAGFGTHPYFPRHMTEDDDTVLVTLPAAGVYPGMDPIPTGPWKEIPEDLDYSREKAFSRHIPIDHCFRMRHGAARLYWPKSGAALTIKMDPVFSHLVLYAPPAHPEYFAAEPVTHCNNAMNMAAEGIQDTGAVLLDPGETLKGTIAFSIDTLT